MKVSDHILDAVERLEMFPDSGSLLPDEWLNKQGYRMVICEKQVAIYRLIGQTVYIYHIADMKTFISEVVIRDVYFRQKPPGNRGARLRIQLTAAWPIFSSR